MALKQLQYTIDPSLAQFPAFMNRYFKEQGYTLSKQQQEIVDYVAYGDCTPAEWATLTPKQKIDKANYGLVMAPRGYIKTTLVSLYICWLMYTDPYTTITYVTATQDGLRAMTRLVRELLMAWEPLHPLSEEYRDNSSKGSYTSETIRLPYSDGRPTLLSKVITSKVTGNRSSNVIFDDIEIGDNSTSVAKITAVYNSFMEYFRLADSAEIQNTRMFGTPWHPASLYYRVNEDKGAVIDGELVDLTNWFTNKGRIWTARYPKYIEIEQYHGMLAPSIVEMVDSEEKSDMNSGIITDPVRILESRLIAEQSSGITAYYMNYMMNPHIESLAERIFDISKLGVIRAASHGSYRHPIVLNDQPQNKLPTILPFTTYGSDMYLTPHDPDLKTEIKADHRYMYIDPAAGILRSPNSAPKGDETAVAIAAIVDGQIIIEYIDGFMNGASPDTYKKIINLAVEYDVHEIHVEDNFGGGMYSINLTTVMEGMGISLAVYSEKVSSRKEFRIRDTIAPLLSNLQLFITEKAIEGDLRKAVESPIYRQEWEDYCFLKQLVNFAVPLKGSSLPHDDRLDAIAGVLRKLQDALGTPSKTAELRKDEQQAEEYTRMAKIFGPDVANWKVYRKATGEVAKQLGISDETKIEGEGRIYSTTRFTSSLH